MITLPVPVSSHGEWRCAQRGFRTWQLAYVLARGTAYRRAGAVFYVLRRRDIPEADRGDEAITRLVGVVVVVEYGQVATAYRNDDPVHHVQRKAKYRAKRRPLIAVDVRELGLKDALIENLAVA